jgi:Trk K+ transport system NAD-binding subunit
MSRHVVIFGTGQIGQLVIEQLVRLGHNVVAVNRTAAR